ncbi:MAG: EAL domain-containing protein [Mycobacterium sp.]|nr:EAL domain-containing protein [Mycobacterium sp.]
MPKIAHLAGFAAVTLAAFVALVLGGALPQSTVAVVADLVLAALSVLAAGSCARAATFASGRFRLAWALMAGALAAFAVGEMIWIYIEHVVDGSPFPSAADAFFLMFRVGVSAALLLFRNRSSPESQGRIVLDGLIVAGSLFIASWTLGLRQVYEAGDATRMDLELLIAYPVGDLVMLTIAAVVVVSAQAGQRVTMTLLTLGLTCMALADSGYAYLSARGDYFSGNIVDIGWVAGLLLLILAAVTARQPTVPDRPMDEVPGWASVWLPYLPLMLAGIVAIARPPIPFTSGPLLTVGVLLAVTVLARQLLAVTENRRLMARVVDRALHDPLTGLANQVFFQDRLARAGESTHDGESMSVLALDLNHFTLVNDSLGHGIGDELLCAVADRIRACVRDEDVVARLGGDEFAVLVVGSPARARRLADRVVESFDKPFLIGGHELLIRPSVGLATTACAAGQNLGEQLLNQANTAMYSGKRSAAAGVHVFNAETQMTDAVDQAVVERDTLLRAVDGAMTVRLLAELRDALDQRDLVLLYQPKFDLLTARVVGVEALLRWQHPVRGLLGPDEFLPLVRGDDLMAAITDFVIHQALDDASRWQSLSVEVPVAINLPAPALVDLELPARLMGALGEHRIEAAALTIEITEDLYLDNLDHARAVLNVVRQSGIRVAIDDFGSGYSALSYLRDLTIDEVKLDRDFIAPILIDPRAAAVVRAVVNLAHELGLTTVAEGVENADTAARLREYGCDVGQGYFFSAPLSAEGVVDLLGQGYSAGNSVSEIELMQ